MPKLNSPAERGVRRIYLHDMPEEVGCPCILCQRRAHQYFDSLLSDAITPPGSRYYGVSKSGQWVIEPNEHPYFEVRERWILAR